MYSDKCVARTDVAGKYMRYMVDGNSYYTVQYSDKDCKNFDGKSDPTECDKCTTKNAGAFKARTYKCAQYSKECSPVCAKGQACKNGKCEKSDLPSGVNGLFLALAMVVLFLF